MELRVFLDRIRRLSVPVLDIEKTVYLFSGFVLRSSISISSIVENNGSNNCFGTAHIYKIDYQTFVEIRNYGQTIDETNKC